MARYAMFAPGADPELAAKYDKVGGTAPSVAGIWRWLEKAAAADESR